MKDTFKTRLNELYWLKGGNFLKIIMKNVELLLEILNYYNQAINLINYKDEKYKRLTMNNSYK